MDLRSPTATKVVGALAMVVLAALGWLVAVGPKTDDLAAVREQITTTQDQNALLGLQLAQLRRQQADLDETRKVARKLAKRFPATADQPGLFQQVTAAAVDAGIGPDGVTTLTPTPPVVGDAALGDGATSDPATPVPAGLARQTVTVSVTGSYDQTRKLLDNLEHMDRAYLVTGLDLAASEVGSYTTTVTGDMFVMPPVPDPGEVVDLVSATPEED
ncbi:MULTISPECIES: type 4a pilus biogenesis protein PilO [unclassified Nocardioides]|uniref:type 4a pilus biogenesis protein PilO n=1 Tax=unclassified Nocardioides TaxID=2615069 RepID=UPI003620B4CA